MLNDKIYKALNEQVNAEFYSAYLYLSMSTYFESQNLKGFAHWMRKQYEEEIAHGMKIFDFIHERGNVVKLEKIEAPKHEWNSTLEIFEESLAHEKKVTGLIHNLVKIAKETDDYASEIFLQWFVSEQVEEESSVEEIIEQLKLIEKQSALLLFLDKELQQR